MAGHAFDHKAFYAKAFDTDAVSGSPDAFDHNAFDFNALDTDAGGGLGIFGGSPRPFFSYSGERLAWTQKPFKPETKPQAIHGRVSTAQSEGETEARGILRIAGRGRSNQAITRSGIGIYTPQRINGQLRAFQQETRIEARGESVDWELVLATILAKDKDCYEARYEA